MLAAAFIMENQTKGPAKPWWRLPFRMAALIVLAYAIGSQLTRISSAVESASEPAGFRLGIVQGALMPMSFPNLLVGRDVAIYSQHNTGVSYKLGYTAGVNGCGALFFGLLYWRVNRWRKWAARKGEA